MQREDFDNLRYAEQYRFIENGQYLQYAAESDWVYLRELAVMHGYNVLKSLEDPDIRVRGEAIKFIKESGMVCEELTDEEILHTIKHGTQDEKVWLAENGFGIELLIKDLDPVVKTAAEEYCEDF